MHFLKSSLLIALALSLAIPSSVEACACSCGVFGVGTGSLLPTQEGGTAYLDYGYLAQNRNWQGSSPSASDNNEDKKVITNFMTAGYRYLFNRRWGLMGEVPWVSRYVKEVEAASGDVMEHSHSSIGDIRLKGFYSGFSEDMSSGVSLGLKLPTGSYHSEHFHPDMQIGSGSTDLLFGGYYRGALGKLAGLQWFTSVELAAPVLHAGGYVPGSEFNGVVGLHFNNWRVGSVQVVPLVQGVGTHRWSDSGTLADAQNTGYSRLVVGPGLEVGTESVRLYTDVRFRVYQYTTGNQLVTAPLFKLNISYHF